MTNLTDKWVKQTLPLGWYYIKLQDGSIEIQQYIGGFLMDVNNNVVEVLAEVPSYEEYQKLLSDQLAKNEGAEINAELEERLKKTQKLELDLRRENRKFKELLKRAKEVLEDEGDYMIVQEIKQVLGEE